MSKWIKKELFENYVQEKEKEVSEKPGMRRSDFVWASPPAGTAEKSKVYEGRFIPDKEGNFTKKYMYHMWKSGDKWNFYLCPKTHDMSEFCPICSIVSTLYTGNETDKGLAFRMKRKERHVGNFFIVNDPRDKEQTDQEKMVNGKVKLYEFPSKLESKLRNEIMDKEEGLGYNIFDPGKEGYNILIKIKSTKQDAKGNSYPDYSDSTFSRKSYPLAKTDAEIDDIMEATYNLKEYIKNMEISEKDTIDMLKRELLWDMVETSWNKYKGAAPVVSNNIKSEEDVSDDIADTNVDIDDDDLLKELKAMER